MAEEPKKKPEEVEETPREEEAAEEEAYDEGAEDGEEVGEEEGYAEGEEDGEFADEGEYPDEPVPGEDPLADDPLALGLPQEPLGASIVRRIHEDHAILMRDYDEMLTLCEEPKVRAWVTGLLMKVETVLSQAEALFAARYPDLPPLVDGEVFEGDGAEGNDFAAGSDYGPEEEGYEGEEEGDEYEDDGDIDGVSGPEAEDGEVEEEAAPNKGPEDSPEDVAETMARRRKSLPGGATKALDHDDEEEGENEEEGDPMTRTESASSPLTAYEKESVKEAHDLLASLGVPSSTFGKREQMKCFHHGECLAKIAKPSSGAKSVELKDEIHPHRGTCGAVARVLHDLSGESAFGNKHRDKCLAGCKALGSLLDEGKDKDDEDDEKDKETPGVGEIGSKDDEEMDDVGEKAVRVRKAKKSKGEPGEEGKKHLDALLEENEKQDRLVRDTTAKLEKLLKCV